MQDKTVTEEKIGGNYSVSSDMWSVALNNDIPPTPFPVLNKKYIVFRNDGFGLTANFSLEYDANNTNYYFEPVVEFNQEQNHELPPDATNIKVRGNFKTILSEFHTIVIKPPQKVKFPSSTDKMLCKVWGLISDPKWTIEPIS